ncbi:MAG: riboflavin biosynthesis protein RibD, partial [Acidobacteria bacterium]
AMTLDGRIATASGESRWITGEAARRIVHDLRYEYDALLVGVHTVLLDDPALDTRGRRQKPVTKVILDSELRTPEHARVFASPGVVVVFHAGGASADRVIALSPRATLIPLVRGPAGLDWDCVLRALGKRGITSVIIEGGGEVAASALKAGAVQKTAFFYAPKILGAEGVPGIGRLEIADLSDVIRLEGLSFRRLGGDLLVEGYPKGSLPPVVQSRV